MTTPMSPAPNGRYRPARATVIAAVLAATIACTGPIDPPQEEAPTLDVTSWTGQSELFMEFPPLVAGQSALFAVHLTRLGDFSALNDGRTRLEFTPESGGAASVLTGPGPSRPGVFRIEGTLPAAGRYQWALVVEAAGLTDRHDLGRVTVFGDEAEGLADALAQPPEDPAAIAYLKEPQWTSGFATALVREAEIRTALRVPAVIEPLTGGEAVVSAPAPGRFTAEELLPVGAQVRAGQALGRLEPRLSGGEDRATLAATVAEAQAAADAARVERARAARLLEDRAVPARRLEEAGRALEVAAARLEAAEARLAQRDETLRTGSGAAAGNTFVLQAPIGGRLATVSATLGASYDEGAQLFRIVRTDEVELQAQVPAADVPVARAAKTIELEIPGRAEPIALEPYHIHDAGVIDRATRALAIQFEVVNPRGELLIGQVGTAVLYGRERRRMPAVPREAVLMEAGRPYVFVQITGERFLRRPIEIVARDGDLVGVKTGLVPGDRIVTRGAYDVQLASAARGLPAEGHVH